MSAETREGAKKGGACGVLVIAIDGPAASGKGTLGRRIAQRLGLAYLDTGLLYRAVALDMLRAGTNLHDADAAAEFARALDLASLDDPRLRERHLGEAASRVAALPAVRAALLDIQRAFAANPPGAVLDGRDIGTVVCPDADVKLYVVASAEERARRRHAELVARGETVTEAEILADIRARDARDSQRADAPMRPAADALLLDTTNLGIDQAFDAAIALIEAANRRGV